MYKLQSARNYLKTMPISDLQENIRWIWSGRIVYNIRGDMHFFAEEWTGRWMNQGPSWSWTIITKPCVSTPPESCPNQLHAKERLIIDLDDSLGWKVYLLNANESFYHHYQWFPDGSLPKLIDVKPRTNMITIEFDEEWVIDDAEKNCNEDKEYFRTGKEKSYL